MLYMLMICYDHTKPADGISRQPEHAKLEGELRQRGTYVSGAGLWPVEAAKALAWKEGETVITDGPFAESKEALGGYFIVDCDEAEAIATAGQIPVDSRSWVQIRPIGLFHPNIEKISKMA